VKAGYLAPSSLIFEEASSRARTSLGVSSTAAAPRFSSSRGSFVVPGIGTIHGFLRKQPSQRDLRRSHFSFVLRRSGYIDQSLVHFAILRAKPWHAVRKSVLSNFVSASICLSRSLSEWAKRDESNPKLFQGRHYLSSGSRQKRVLALQRLRRPELRGRGGASVRSLQKTEVLSPCLPESDLDSARNILDRNVQSTRCW